MTKIFSTNCKWVLGSLLTILTLLIALSHTAPSSAQPPLQQGDQPDFTVSVQTAPDGSATIRSQEALLNHHYFSDNGSLEGVRVTPAGIRLGEGEGDGTYVSGVIYSPLAFTTDIVPLWQAELPDETEVMLETRLSFGGQSWSEWLENPVAFYPVRDDMFSGNLIWAGQEQVALQFRVTLRSAVTNISPTLRSFTLVFSDTSDGPTDGDIARQMGSRMAGASPAADICPAKPDVVSRTDWGCPHGRSSPYRPPVYHPVTHIIIHQTETPNEIDPYQDWAGWVRSVWHYHARILWWGDVGYNYLIDPNGVIYEGRAGGDDVVGIHDGYNYGSMAIGFLGCYGNCDDPRLSVAEPSEAMLASAARLMAWKLGQNGIDPHSSGPYGKWHDDVPVIAGGRDVTWTSSPGDHLYDQLPSLRDAVEDKLEECQGPLPACRIDDILFDQAEYKIGDPIHLTVKLVDHEDHPLGGALVTYEVEITGIVDSLATAAAFDMIDRTGDYDGVYTATTVGGAYTFKFSASDPTGEKFAPCSAEAMAKVRPELTPPQCQLTAQADPTSLQTPGGPVDLKADVTLNGAPVTDANVIAQVTKPTGSNVDVILPSQGDGSYAQPFTDTAVFGDYDFSVTADGQGFSTCSADNTFSVEPGGTAVVIEPATAQLCEGDGIVTTQIKIAQVADMQGFAFKLNFDPDVVSVVDADPSTPDVIEIRLGDVFNSSLFFVAKNEVNDGLIDFAGAFQGDNSFSGGTVLAEIDWSPVEAGDSALTFSEMKLSDPDGMPIEHEVIAGAIEVTQCAGITVIGQIYLQGRPNHSGAVVSSGPAHQVQTSSDGFFTLPGGDLLTVKLPGYLSAQADLQTQLGQVSNVGPINLGVITLLAGDTNGDDLIDIFDLAYLGSRYDSTDPTADLNSDGMVDILDLAVAAGNYGQQGPLTNWR